MRKFVKVSSASMTDDVRKYAIATRKNLIADDMTCLKVLKVLHPTLLILPLPRLSFSNETNLSTDEETIPKIATFD